MDKYKCITCREEYVPMANFNVFGFCSKRCWMIYRKFWKRAAERSDKGYNIEDWRVEIDAELVKE